MTDQSTIYPNLSWSLFEINNDNKTDSFEDMCRDLFYCEYLHEKRNPHSDHNNPGVEVLPILEPVRDDGQPQKRISYQAKYFEKNISNSKIIDSLQQAVSHYNGELGRIYLFCNLTISRDSDRFKKFQAIVSPANIDLELITNKDIFTLLRKHKRVADYYFQDRKRTAASANILMGNAPVTTAVSDSVLATQQSIPNVLLQELIKDKIDKCRDAILDLKFGVLKSELSVLSSATDADAKVAYYQMILAVHENEEITEFVKAVSDDVKDEAYWIKNLCRTPREIVYSEIIDFSPETQIITLIVLFAHHLWQNIVDLHKHIDKFSLDIRKAFDFHYALSLFNLREEDKAHGVLSGLFDKYHEPRFELYDICSKLNKANREYIYGREEQEQLVKNLLSNLDRVKAQSTDQLKGNGNLVATIELQSCFNLGATSKSYIDEAIRRYEGYSEEIKSFEGVRFFMAMCYEMGGDQETATDLFAQCSWREEENVAARYLTSLIDLHRPEEVISAYDEITIKTPRVECIYLLALYRAEKETYETSLKDAIEKHDHSLEDLFLYGFYVEDSTIFKRVVLPKLSSLLPDALSHVESQIKIGLLATFAHNGCVDEIGGVLESLQDLQIINYFVAHDVYNCLFVISHKEYEAWRHDEEYDKDLKKVEAIANRFYEANVLRRDFLQIKLMCASVANMDFSMLKYSKELFEYTHDVQTARNIIALLYKRNETKREEYEPYLEPLMKSDDPQICVAASSALWRLGRYDDADFFAYKALYNLNGEDDFDVYKSLFGYHNLNMQRTKDLPKRKTIGGNMAVTLKAGKEVWQIILDSESECWDADNRSLGVEHIIRKDPIYSKLLGSGKGQALNLRGKSYTVVGFEPREITIGRFIFQKVSENPDKFNVRTIPTKNTEEMVKEIFALSDHREHTKEMLEAYNFETSELGIPIDFFVDVNYDKYIEGMRYLLHTDDLAYYAGEPRLEYVDECKYIPTLSTLVLLAMNGWLDTLDWLGDRIIIPESYTEFFREQHAKELGTQAVSMGSLIPLDDGKFAILDKDKSIPEIWEKILVKCESFNKVKVTDDERIAFEILEGHTWERLFGKTGVDMIQLDGLLVAEREEGVYLCDDLFFRKFAATKGIKHINFATLLYMNSNLEDVMPIILELSKTNYVYTPFRCRDTDEEKQLIHNLLKGEKKNMFYTDFFNT